VETSFSGDFNLHDFLEIKYKKWLWKNKSDI